jgi:hypothetical protein
MRGGTIDIPDLGDGFEIIGGVPVDHQPAHDAGRQLAECDGGPVPVPVLPHASSNTCESEHDHG